MSTLSSLGIGSGLDVQSIVSQLMSVEQQPLNKLQTKATAIQTQVSLYGQIKSAYSNLQSSIQALSNDANRTQLLGLQSSSSDTSIATATINANVPTGIYNLTVNSLASTQQLVSSGITDPAASLSTSNASLQISFGKITGGTLDSISGTYSGASFTPKTGTLPNPISIPAGTSLNGLRDLINKAKLGVSATVVNDGTQYHLTLSSTTPGASNSLSLQATGDASLASFINQDPSGQQNFKQTSAASDLTGTLNGLSITSSSNTLTNNIPGLTINALKVGSSTLNVSTNSSGPSSLLSGVVNNWNALNALTRQLTSYDPATKKSGPLIGESLVENSLNTVRQQLFSATASKDSAANSNFNSLLQIGLNVDSKGVASLDSSKLTKALQSDPNAVVNLLSASSGGAKVTQKAESLLSNLLGTSTGFQTKLDSLNGQLKSNQKKQDALNVRLTQVQAALTKQYTALDTTVSKLQKISSSLSASLSSSSTG